jgi:hypothetical protein
LELAAYLASEDAQRTRAASGLEIPAFRDVALEIAAADTLGLERVFLNQVGGSRLPWGAIVSDFHEIEELTFDIMDRHLLRGEDLAATAASVASEIDRMRTR